MAKQFPHIKVTLNTISLPLQLDMLEYIEIL